MYNSKYYTCEQVDQRLLQGYYDDAVATGYTGSKAQYLAGLLKAINYSANPTLTADKVVYDPAISGLTSKNVKAALDELTKKITDGLNTEETNRKKEIKELKDSIDTEITKLQKKDTTHDTKLDELEKSVWPLGVTLSASPTLVEYTGSNQAITLVSTTTRKGTKIDPNTLTLTKDGTSISTRPLSQLTVTDNLNKRGITKYQVSVAISNPILSASASVQVNSVLPIYIGFSTLTALTETDIKGLNKQSVRTSLNGSYTINNSTNGAYVWFCVPDDMVIHKVTLNGFDVPMESPVTVSTSLGNYKCYRNSNPLVNQSFTFVIS